MVVKLRIVLIGVLISWDICARNSDCNLSDFSANSFAFLNWVSISFWAVISSKLPSKYNISSSLLRIAFAFILAINGCPSFLLRRSSFFLEQNLS